MTKTPADPLFEEERQHILEAADRFEHANPEELLEWALDRFHPRMAISAAGGVDGMAIVDMAWRINPEVRVFTLDTGRLPAESYALFEKVRDRYGIDVEFELPDRLRVERLVSKEGPNLMYRSLDLRLACCEARKVEPMKRKLATLDAWVAGLRRDQWRTRKSIANRLHVLGSLFNSVILRGCQGSRTGSFPTIGATFDGGPIPLRSCPLGLPPRRSDALRGREPGPPMGARVRFVQRHHEGLRCCFPRKAFGGRSLNLIDKVSIEDLITLPGAEQATPFSMSSFRALADRGSGPGSAPPVWIGLHAT